MLKFKINKTDSSSKARTGEIEFAHGKVKTPVFMPVGTLGNVKTLDSREVVECNSQIILGNTYHLYLRPGLEVLSLAGGLHKFMNYSGPILTDSGGFQVFSLSNLCKIDEDGVTFASHIDGSRHRLTPERSIEIQRVIGSDVMMAFDECIPYGADEEYTLRATERTHRWAERCLDYLEESKSDENQYQNLFGIIQGGFYPELRKMSAEKISSLPFNGIAIGGLSVGEPNEMMVETLEQTVPFVDRNRPLYLMGVGTPKDFVNCVHQGVDMFDCVNPSRMARHGCIFTWEGRLNIKNRKYQTDFSPIDSTCKCKVCQDYSRSYLRHLFVSREILGMRLATYHNIYFFNEFMEKLRESIDNGTFAEFRKKVLEIYS